MNFLHLHNTIYAMQRRGLIMSQRYIMGSATSIYHSQPFLKQTPRITGIINIQPNVMQPQMFHSSTKTTILPMSRVFSKQNKFTSENSHHENEKNSWDHQNEHDESTDFEFTFAQFRRAPWGTVRKWWQVNSGKFRSYLRNYGTLTITAYFSLYSITLGTIWAFVEVGWVKGPDVNKWLNKWSMKRYWTEDEIKVPPRLTNFLTAWLLTKTTEPVRVIVTLFTLPLLLRYLPMWVLRIFKITARPQFKTATKGAKAAGKALRSARDKVRDATNKRKGGGDP